MPVAQLWECGSVITSVLLATCGSVSFSSVYKFLHISGDPPRDFKLGF